MFYLRALMAAVVAAVMTAPVLATAVDVTATATDITGQIASITIVGGAVLGVYVAIKGFKWVRRALS